MEPVVCYSCGNPISDVYEAFQMLRNIYVAKKLGGTNVDINNVDFVKTDIDLADMFKQLNIEKWCCKVNMTTTVNFNEMRAR